MAYLAWIAYVIFLHLLSLGSYIIGFNLLEGLYLQVVKASLALFMNNIREMLVKSSVFLYALMNILIRLFCLIINYIFAIIKAKLLFYLILVEKQIVADVLQLSDYMQSYNKLLMELQLLLDKYIKILEKVEGLLDKLNALSENILRNFGSIFSGFYKVVKILICKLKSIWSSCDKVNRVFSLLNQKLSSLVIHVDNSKNIIITWKEISDNKVTASIMNFNTSDTSFQKSVTSIKKILEKIPKVHLDVSNEIDPIMKKFLIAEIISNSKGVSVSPLMFNLNLIHKFENFKNFISKLSKTIQLADRFVSGGIISITGQLLKVETINLVKLYELITQMQMLYLKILVRGNLLKCTIEFYNDVTRNVSEMFGSLKFKCSDCREFLCKCSEIEKYISTVSSSINECIIKLATFCKSCEGCIFRKEPIELFIKLIGRILILKFYVDLIMLEILIFKMIILTLVQMTVSSVLIDELIKLILGIKDVDSAILTLVAVNVWLRAFYVIQLENTLVIFGLSSKLMLSESIHKHYYVLFLNLDLINRLIWVIECYIQHLFVFRHVTKGLNSLIEDIGALKDIIVQIYKVIGSMAAITNKLRTIDNSIEQLKTVSDDATITKWKESAQGIRDQIKSINTNVREINSELTQIKAYVDSILKSWIMLIYLEKILLLLIYYVKEEIEKTNKYKILGSGVGNDYYTGLIVSVMEPCNKQLKFIFWYLIDMWFNLVKLIKIVGETIVLIHKEMGLLSSLTKILQEDMDKIDKGVVAIECAIEGVARNLIGCSLESLSTHIIGLNGTNINVHR